MSSQWTYRSEPFTPENIPAGALGFVYLITNTVTGKKYLGKKLLQFRVRKKVTLKNGKKKTVKCLKESDWQDYFGSSAEFLTEVENTGREKFTREILHVCSSKAECSYLEAYEQMVRGVLLTDDYANGWISVRVTKSHLKKYSEKMGFTKGRP